MREIIKREDPELESGIADTMLRLWCKEMDITLGRGNQYTSKSKTNKKEVESLKARMDSVEEKLEALIDLLGGTQKIETPRQTNLPHINA